MSQSAGSERQDRSAVSAFDAKAEAWQRYTETPLGRLRQDITIHGLMQRLAERSAPLTVLDAGAGSGGYALALARGGHHVTLLDLSPAMLALARDRLAKEEPALLEASTFCCASLAEAIHLWPDRQFDVVLAHTLLEYLEQPWEALETLVARLAPGGLMSILATNPAAIAFRWAVGRGDPEQALAALSDPNATADLFDLPRRTLKLEDLRAALTRAGLESISHRGVRIFADYQSDRLGDQDHYAALWQLELAASGLDPYRGIARYHHLLAQRPLRTDDTEPEALLSPESLQER